MRPLAPEASALSTELQALNSECYSSMLHPRTKVDDLMLSMTETIHGISQGNTQAILWGASAYFLICGLYSLTFQWRISQWESVWGSLLHTEIERLVPDNDISEQEYKVKALYTYNVKGNTYEGKRLSPWVFVVSHNARLLLSQQLKGVTRNAQGQN